MELRKAQKQKSRIRMGFSAVAGGGKTYSALLVAKGLCGSWDKVAIIDTENGSADLYADLGEYNTLPLQSPYTPERYIQAIKTCEDAGMEVIIIDSITHEWDGKGGVLEIQNAMGGRYQDWASVTPRHQKFLDAILSSKCHILTTVRRKQDYSMEKGSDGKLKVEKAGLKEITREGYEYELTLNLEMDTQHMATASKDRTGLFMDKDPFIPTEETGKLILQWCESGIEPIKRDPKAELRACKDLISLQAVYNSLTPEEKHLYVTVKDDMKIKLNPNKPKPMPVAKSEPEQAENRIYKELEKPADNVKPTKKGKEVENVNK